MLTYIIAIGAAIAAYYFLYYKKSCSDGKTRVVTLDGCAACAELKKQANAEGIHLVNLTDVYGLDKKSQEKLTGVPAVMVGCDVKATGVKDVKEYLKQHQHAHTMHKAAAHASAHSAASASAHPKSHN